VKIRIIITGGTFDKHYDEIRGNLTFKDTHLPEILKFVRCTVPIELELNQLIDSLDMQTANRMQVLESCRRAPEDRIVITHGTDTMAYSAAALSFMIDTPVPIVFVGSQRSADRPSSDNAMNAVCAAAAAISDLGEVAIVMHATTSDDVCSIHRGTRVRKMHTSRRDAFRSMGISPIGRIEFPSKMVTLEQSAIRRGTHTLALHDRLEPNCAMVQFYPGMSPDLLKSYSGYKGLVIAGTGLGHVSTALIPGLVRLIHDGTTVIMTSQCMHGRVCDRVYDTGRDLLAAGVIEGGDTMPEAALVKLMWVLANEKNREKAAALMQRDLKGECMRRSAYGL